MVINEKKTLTQLHAEAESLEASVNAQYREMLVSAAELIEMYADMIAAMWQQDAEKKKLLRQAADAVADMEERLKRQLDIVTECEVPNGTDLKEMDRIGRGMEEEAIKRALLCGAMKVEQVTDIAHACKVVRVRLSVAAEQVPEDAEHEG